MISTTTPTVRVCVYMWVPPFACPHGRTCGCRDLRVHMGVHVGAAICVSTWAHMWVQPFACPHGCRICICTGATCTSQRSRRGCCENSLSETLFPKDTALTKRSASDPDKGSRLSQPQQRPHTSLQHPQPRSAIMTICHMPCRSLCSLCVSFPDSSGQPVTKIVIPATHALPKPMRRALCLGRGKLQLACPEITCNQLP